MAFQGELKTYALPDLFQWLDGARKEGRLTVVSSGREWVFFLQASGIEYFGTVGLYDRLARLLRTLKLIDERAAAAAVEHARAGNPVEETFAAIGIPEERLREIARDDACQSAADLFEDNTGTFHFTEDLEAEGEERVLVGIGVREIVYEAARRIDEAAPALDLVRDDAQEVHPLKAGEPGLSPLAEAAMNAVGAGSTVGGVRLALGLSKRGAARIFQELMRRGLVQIEGAGEVKPDPLTKMLRQGEKLLADGHYEAAFLVSTSLLSTDPSDRRVREFARAVEREHVDALYRKLLPVAVPQVLNAGTIDALRADERIVARLVNGRWDVSTLVLASPLRELPTLRAIERMVELGFAALE